MNANGPSSASQRGRKLANLLSDAAARQATTPPVPIVSHAVGTGGTGDPQIALFTGPAAGGVAQVASFSFGNDQA